MIYKKNDYIPSDSTFYSRPAPSFLSGTSSVEEHNVFVQDEFNPHSFKVVVIEQDQSWYWLPEWQRMENEADQNLKDSDYEDFNTVDKFIASL